MKMSPQQIEALVDELKKASKDADKELINSISKIANECQKLIADGFRPFIESEKFNQQNKNDFINALLTTLGMITAKELFILVITGFGQLEDLGLIFNKKLNDCLALLIAEHENPDLKNKFKEVMPTWN